MPTMADAQKAPNSVIPRYAKWTFDKRGNLVKLEMDGDKQRMARVERIIDELAAKAVKF